MDVIPPDVVRSISLSPQPNLIAGERNPFVVYCSEHRHVIVRVPWCMEYLKFVLLSLERLALRKRPFDRYQLGIGTAKFVAMRMPENIGHILVAPDARPVIFL